MILSKILLPRSYRKIGWILFIHASILGLLALSVEFEFSWLEFNGFRDGAFLESTEENFTNEVAILSLFLNLFFIALAKKKEEDEDHQKLRLDSILFACYGYFILNVIGAIMFYGFDYLTFMSFNMFFLPLLFILRFRWMMFQQRKFLCLVL
ncbi:hypothetical protein [Algoriphagus sp.]|uniref:hypothetical protein n=1 Tax=Algoriphagus sp. TaxID=1872435 RepID=UPI0025EF309D|nr:hypothetical protein [Algoriphagus sp.]